MEENAPAQVFNLVAIVSILTANAIMTISQGDLASLYLPISLEFHQTVYGLGIMTTVFFLGYMFLEMPGSILGARLGPKRLLLIGGCLTTAANLVGALAPSFVSVIALRMLCGAGLGLFFPSALVALIRNSKPGWVATAIAMLAVSFGLGGAAGVFGWSVLGATIGWRLSTALVGILTACGIATVWMNVPRDRVASGFRITVAQLWGTFANRALLTVSAVILGVSAASGVVGNFLVYYLEETLGVGPGVAGLIAAASYVVPMLTSFVAGRLYDRGFGERRLLLLAAIGVTVGTCATAIHSIYAATFASVVCGLAVGVAFTVAFAVARNTSTTPEYESLAVSVVDGASLIGLLVSPLYFSPIALWFGYPWAWLVGGLAAAVCAIPLVTLRRPEGSSRHR